MIELRDSPLALPDDVIAETIGPIRRRETLTSAASATGAVLERVTTASGRFIVKHLPPQGDWLTRATNGRHRVRVLWERGILDQVADIVDHATVNVVGEGDACAVVMRDVSRWLMSPAVNAAAAATEVDRLPAIIGRVVAPPEMRVPRADSRRLLSGLATIHRRFHDQDQPDLCAIGARYAAFAPARHRDDTGPSPNEFGPLIVAAWNVFADLVPDDVRDAIFMVHDDPTVLARPLAEFPATLVHGDPKMENLGLGPDRMILLDWGELTGFGPPEIDVAWYVHMNQWRIGAGFDDLFSDYETVAGRRLNPPALDYVCIGSLAQMGMTKAGVSVVAPDEDTRRLARAQLDWWVHRVRDALERVPLG